MRQAWRSADRNTGTFSAYQFQGPEVRHLCSASREASFRSFSKLAVYCKKGALEEWLRKAGIDGKLLH